ncbi:hypothetical protein LCGC14_0355470 [marine sediment metagenome]|uniref:Uncharacterized protein n=1 Tax=marine sediment metagenome TaxID=412755 RepID=A0A0F9TSQ1_9ZZZZ
MVGKEHKKSNLDGHINTGGRPKGSLNKTTAMLREAIIMAAQAAGDSLAEKGKKKEGIAAYLKDQAVKNPTAFMTLLGKVLPPPLPEGLTGFLPVSFVAYMHGAKEEADAQDTVH